MAGDLTEHNRAGGALIVGRDVALPPQPAGRPMGPEQRRVATAPEGALELRGAAAEGAVGAGTVRGQVATALVQMLLKTMPVEEKLGMIRGGDGKGGMGTVMESRRPVPDFEEHIKAGCLCGRKITYQATVGGAPCAHARTPARVPG